MSIIILGDLHFRKEEPFATASRNFINWFSEQKFNNNQNTLVQLGDLFHYEEPNPIANEIAMNFFHNLKFKKTFILAGNHDYNRRFDSFSVQPFSYFINYVKDISILKIEDQKILFIPSVYITPKQRVMTEENYYYQKIKDLDLSEVKYCFHHVYDELQFQPEMNFTFLKEKEIVCIGGHVHIQNINLELIRIPGNRYLGVPYPHRSDEKNQQGAILELGEYNGFTGVPKFLDYENVIYGDEVKGNPEGELIINIFNSPTEQLAKEKYKNYNINKHGITLLPIQISENGNDELTTDLKKTQDLFKDYTREKSLNKNVAKLIRGVLK